MGKSYTNNSLGYDFELEMPFSNEAEYNALAGRPDAAFEDLSASVCYGKPNADFRRLFGQKLAEATGVPQTKQVEDASGILVEAKDAKGNPVLIETKAFRDMLLATNKITEAECQMIAIKVGKEISDAGVKVPTGTRSGNKLEKEYLDAGSRKIATLAAEGRSIEEWIEKFMGTYPEYPGQLVATDESIGRALKYNTAEVMKKNQI